MTTKNNENKDMRTVSELELALALALSEKNYTLVSTLSRKIAKAIRRENRANDRKENRPYRRMVSTIGFKSGTYRVETIITEIVTSESGIVSEVERLSKTCVVTLKPTTK